MTPDPFPSPVHLFLIPTEMVRQIMEGFPFAKSEWASVTEATRHVLNARLAEDEEAHNIAFLSLREMLFKLRDRYGSHPILLETEADFCDDVSESETLYRQAKELARRNGLPALSIGLALARLLLSQRHEPAQARIELEECSSELSNADDSDREDWCELFAACSATES